MAESQNHQDDEIIEFIVKTVGTGQTLLKLLQRLHTIDPNSEPVLNFQVELDLTKIMRTSRGLAMLILSEYSRFANFLNKTVFDVLHYNVSGQKHNLSLLEKLSLYPAERVSCSVHFTSCPVLRRNFLNSEYLRDKMGMKNGVLIYLKEALVISAKQPELFLWGWTETWKDCLCISKEEVVLNNQTFYDVVGSGKLKEKKQQGANSLGEKKRCAVCNADFKTCAISDQIYLPCQEITICCDITQNKPKEEMFQPSIFKMYLSNHKVGEVKAGNVYDFCCLNFTITRLKGGLAVGTLSAGRIRCQLENTMACVCSYRSLSHTNTQFFSMLAGIKIRYLRPFKSKSSKSESEEEKNSITASKLSKPFSLKGYNSRAKLIEDYDVEKLYSNYTELLEAINDVDFPYCKRNCLTLLKLGVLASVFHKHRSHILQQCNQQSPALNHNPTSSALHLLIISDEQNLVSKIMQLKNLKIKSWPVHYDSSTIASFMVACFNSIVLFRNPSKRDLGYLSQFLQGKVPSHEDPSTSIYNLNTTVWVVINPQNLKTYSKQFPSDKFDIILDVTFLNNNQNRRVEHDISSTVLMFLDAFTRSPEDPDRFFCGNPEETIVRRRRFRGFDQEDLELKKVENHQEVDNGAQEEAAKQLLEVYYVRSREHKQTSLRNFISLEKTAYSISLIRSFFSKSSVFTNISDILLAVFLEEETSRNRRGNQNTLFSNDVAKFLLNETDTISVADFDYERLVGGVKTQLPKKEVFKRIISDFALLVGHQ